MIKIGGKIGALNTVSLIFLTAFVGIYFAKIEGVKTMKSGLVNFYKNKAPIFSPMLIIRKISNTGNPINSRKNEFICLIQNYINNVYLSNNE